MYARGDRAYPWRESIILFFAAFLAYELKRRFGLFAFRVFKLGNVAHPAWLGLGAPELITLGTIILGLAVYQRTPLPNAPLLERLLYRKQAAAERIRIWRPVFISTAIILVMTIVLSVLTAHIGHHDKLFGTLHSGRLSKATLHKLWTLYPLAVIGAPISEEIHFRLALISIIVWLLAKTMPNADRRGLFLLWFPIVVTGVYFGYVHVSQNLETVQTGNLYLSLLVAPQTWAGIILGYVFCTYGLEASMLTHFLADAVVPVLAGLFVALSRLLH